MFPSVRNNKILRTKATLALALAGLASQGAHADKLNPVLGGGLGAMAGALIGQSVGGRDGALIGAAVGGVAGVSMASDAERHHGEPARTVVYQNVRPAPVVVYPQPYRPVPVYGYREVERVTYFPQHDHGHHRGWDRGWERHDEYRRDGAWHGGEHGGEHRGWGRD